MPQSLARVLVHMVFSTKHREPLIPPPLRERVFSYLGGILAGISCPPVIVGGTSDHVHALFVLSKNLALSKAAEELKKDSSKWAKLHVHPAFYWQSGYGAFSVDPEDVDAVRAYIATQEQHHAAHTFQDEVRDLYRKAVMDWDERYVWD